MPTSSPTRPDGATEAIAIRSSDAKEVEEHIENVSETTKRPVKGTYIAPEEIQQRFELLREKSPEQMEALNKNVLKKIDWHLMPCVTLMFLMKYVFQSAYGELY